jgi:hypothetical protein
VTPKKATRQEEIKAMTKEQRHLFLATAAACAFGEALALPSSASGDMATWGFGGFFASGILLDFTCLLSERRVGDSYQPP